MADTQASKVLEDLLDAEGGTLTIANFKTYYAAYCREQVGSTPVKYADFLAVLESFYRNSAIAGEA